MAWYKTLFSAMNLEIIVTWIREFSREKLNVRNPDFPYYITIGVAAVLFVIALNGFIELTDEVAENEMGAFDRVVSDYVTRFRSETLTGFFSAITRLGERIQYVVISILIAGILYWRYRSISLILQTVAVLILASVSNIALKRSIGRARPEVEHLVYVDSMSYPSGHSMSAMAFYGFLIYLCLKIDMPLWARLLLVATLVFVIAAVGVSRVYLGVHFPSDVAAGFIGGLIWVSFCILLFNLIFLFRRKKTGIENVDDL